MLGIGNIVTAGSKVANVVRKGLQAWYKADQTQAPLSEERINNPNFSLGPNVDLLDHSNWYRNTTTPTAAHIADGPDFIAHGNTPDTPIDSGTTGVTLTEHGFRYKTTGTSTFISMAQNNIMNSAAANEETLMLTYDILQNNGSGILYIAMSSNDTALDVTVGKNKVHYFTPTTNTFQIKRGGSNVDITIANIRLVKTNPTIKGNKWAVSKLASQDMTCTLTQSSNLVGHPSNTNIKVGMKVQGTGIPSNTTITEVNVNGSNTQFRISNNASSSAPATSALRIRAASTVHVEDRAVFIDYNSTDDTNTGVSLGNKIKLNQKYQVEVVVDELSTDQKLKIQTGDDFNHLSLGVNTFEMMSTSGQTISLARSFNSTSVTAKVSKVSLKEITNSVKDFSTNSNDAILRSGKALHFNGTDDRIDLGNASDLVGHENFTVAFWAKTDMTAAQNDVRFFTASNTNSSTYFSIGMDSTKRLQMYLRFTNQNNESKLFGGNGLTNNGGTALVQDVAINDNQWRRIVVSSTKYITRFYINGELIKIFDITKNSEYTGSAFLGGGPSATSNDLTGDIADFQVYNKAWTPDDVTFDYNNPDKDVFDDEGRVQVLGSEKSPAINNTNWETNSIHWPAGYNPISDDGIITWGDTTRSGFAGVQPKSAYYDRTVVGRYYLITFDATRTSGTLQFKASGDVGAGAGVNVTSSGTFSNIIQADGIGWYFTATSNFVGTVSNISLKEVIVHAGEISPTSCLKLLRLNEGSGLRLYDAAPVLSEELASSTVSSAPNLGNELADVTSASPASGDENDWTLFNNTTTIFKASPNNPSYLINVTPALETGKFYAISLTVSNYSGSDTLGFAGHGGVSLNARLSANGTYTEVITGNGNALRLFGRDTNNATITISVKEVLVNYSFIGNPTINNAGSADDFLDLTTGASTNNVLKQTIATEVGALYIFQFELVNSQIPGETATTMAIAGRPSSTSTDDDVTSYTNTPGVKKLIFTPSTTSTDLFVRAGTSVRRVQLRNVSAKKITPSTSYFYADGGHDSTEWIDEQPHIPQYAMSSFSKKLFFDGASRVHGTSSLGVPNNFTASVWYTPDGTGTSSSDRRTIFGFAKASGEFTFRTFEISHWEDGGDNFDGQHDDLFVWSGNGDTSASQTDTDQSLPNGGYVSKRIESNYSSNPSKLTHIAVSVSDGVYKAYVNGILKETFTPGWYDTSLSASQNYSVIDNFVIGARRNNSQSSPAEGIVDEVSLFNKVLSHDEIKEIFNAGIALDVRDHSCYTTELLQKGDWVSQGAIGDTTTPWFKNNNASAHFNCVIGSFKGRTNVMKYSTVLQQDGTVANTNTKKLTQELPAFSAGEKFICEVDVWVEFGDFRCDSQNTYIDTNFVQSNATGGWVTLTSNVLTALQDNTNVAEFWIRPASDGLHSEFYVDKVSFKRYDLKGYWRNDGSETWTDLSPYGNNGTVAGTPQTIQLQEVPLFKKDSLSLPMNKVRQRALNFDGESYVEINDHNSLDLGTGPFTIEAWAKAKYVDNGSTVNVIFSLGGNLANAAHNTAGLAMFSTGRFGAMIDGQNFDADDVAVEGLWYHVVFRRNSSGVCSLYINGEQQTDHTPTIATSTTNTYSPRIGADSNIQRCYHSLIDDVKVYNRLLSTSEIKRNYNATKSKHKSNIVSNWSDDFDDSFI